jgi:hypothetical protein
VLTLHTSVVTGNAVQLLAEIVVDASHGRNPRDMGTNVFHHMLTLCWTTVIELLG